MGLSRRNAFILYTIVLLPCIGLVTVFQGIANVALACLWLLCVLSATIYYLCTKPAPKPIDTTKQPQSVSKSSDAEPLSRSLMPAAAGTTTDQTDDDKISINITSAGSSPTKQRLDFLDNLKSFLTFIVVTHHITCMFGGGGWYFSYANYYNPFLLFSASLLSVDQSYFMSLFFFISGYFTPSSYTKRGTHCFLFSKFKRLGIPLLVYFFILSPISNNLINHVFVSSHDDNSTWFQPDFGPCWYVAWLLIFNVCYCIMDDSVTWYDKKLPTNMKLFVYGIVFGIIQFVVIMLLPIGSFVGMPITMGSLPFDILFFVSGTLAKRNEWIQSIVSNHFHIYSGLLCVFLSVSFAFWSYYSNFGMAGLAPKKGASESCDDDESTGLEWTPFSAVIIVSWVLFTGVCCIEISLGMIQFAATNMNVRNGFTKFFSASAYTVYIIHPLIISPVAWSYMELLRYFYGMEVVFCDGDNNSKTHFDHDWMIWTGWVYTMILSMVIVWPLAYAIKQIPGVRDVV